MNELEVVSRLSKAFSCNRSDIELGIGDDAAIISDFFEGKVVVSSDALVDRVHFDSTKHSLAQIGYKAMAVNLSDLAAMAALPKAALVTVIAPKNFSTAQYDELIAAIAKIARDYDCPIIGGDTNSSDGPLTISITILGEASERGCALRSGAKEGDFILVTGELGGSIQGRHLNFSPRIEEAQYLNKNFSISSMMDVSDGLAIDLRRLASSSGVQMILDLEKIPISNDCKTSNPEASLVQRALSDGEDFELCFTTSPADAAEISRRGVLGIAATIIGEVQSGSGVFIRKNNGSPTALEWNGFEH